MRDTRAIVFIVGSFLGISLAGIASANPTAVQYTVERKPLRAVTATTPLVFELYDDAGCTNLVYSESLEAADPVVRLEMLQRPRLKGAPAPVKAVRIHAVLDAPEMESAPFLRVTGAGITALDQSCQVQAANPVSIAGMQGPQGPQGPAGADGATGPMGPAGTAGAEGPQGPQGPQGPAGAEGPQGPPGPEGPAGAEGPQGPQGPQGPAGVNQQWLGGGGLANRNATIEYFGMWGVSGTASTLVATVAPLSGSITDWRLVLTTSPGAGNGYTFVLHAGANTLSCNVNTVGATTCPGTLSVAAGDLVYLEERNTGPTAPANNSNFQWGATFTSP